MKAIQVENTKAPIGPSRNNDAKFLHVCDLTEHAQCYLLRKFSDIPCIKLIKSRRKEGKKGNKCSKP